MIGAIRNFFLKEIEAQHGRFYVWWPFCLALGIGAYFALPAEPPLIFGLILWAFAMAVLILSGTNLRAAMILILLAVTGFAAAQIRTTLVYTPIIAKDIGPVDVSGRIVAVEDYGADPAGSRITLGDLSIEDLDPSDTPRFIRLRLRKDEGIRVGQEIKALTKLHKPSPPLIPRGFDFQRYLYFQGIGAVGFIYYPPEILSPGSSFFSGIEALRQSIAGRIEAQVDYPEAGIVMALMIGRRTAIDESDQQAMRDAGLAHMLAISGLHVGLLAGVVFFLVRLALAAVPPLALTWPIKKIAAAAALCAALFYTALAGATIPTQRALIMVGLVLIAVMLDREAISLRLVGIAAFVVLLLFPESLMSASFQLSFAAVTALVVFYEWARPWLSRWYRGAGWARRLALYFVGMILTTFIASTAIAPFALFHFQRWAVYDIPANMLAGPLMAFLIMPAAALSFLTMPIGLDYAPLKAMELGVSGVLDIAHTVSNWPMAVVTPAQWSYAAFVLFVLGAFIMAFWRGRLRWAGVIIILAGIWPLVSYRLYDVLIAERFSVVAVRDESGEIYVSQDRSESFVRESWARSYGTEPEKFKTWPQEGKRGPFTCGEQGCRIRLKGQKIAYIRNKYELDEACAWADVIIAPVPLGWDPCPEARVIDLFDTFDGAAHGIKLNEQELTIDTSQGMRGRRPWSAQD